MYVSVQHAARRLGVSPVTVRRWTANGTLPCKRTPGGHRRISTEDLDEVARQIREKDHMAAKVARERELETVLDISIALATKLDLSELLAELARQVTRLFDCDYCTIYEYDRENDQVRILSDFDRTGRRWPTLGPYRLADYPLTRRVIEEQTVAQVSKDDPGADRAELAALAVEGDAHMVMVPLVYRGQCIGLLEATDHERTRRRTRQELRMVRAIASHAAVAMVNARTIGTIREGERQLAAMRGALARLREMLPEAVEAPDRDKFLKTVAEGVCRALDAVSCVAAADGASAGATGQTRLSGSGQGRAHVVVERDQAGLTDLELTVALTRAPSAAQRETVQLAAAIASAILRNRASGSVT